MSRQSLRREWSIFWKTGNQFTVWERTFLMIRIYTFTHKKYDLPPDDLYQPLHVGRALHGDLGYPGDDTGDNISHLNRYYSELTGIYWIWKNCRDVEYVGTSHYRRYLLDEERKLFTAKKYLSSLKEYDIITTRRVVLNHSYHYGFAANHNIAALDMVGEILKEKYTASDKRHIQKQSGINGSETYPPYYETFVRLVNGPETYFGNLFVTSKKKFDAYAEWLFDIFFEVQKRIDLETGEDDYHKRVFGFISEFLLLVWVQANQYKALECMVGVFGEKAETREMKEKLAEFLKKQDIDGAKTYFMEKWKSRPDILMEASDLTGELRLIMQIITTADHERKNGLHTVLEQGRELPELIQIFRELNSRISRQKTMCHKAEYNDLHQRGISEIAVQIAEKLLI